MTNNILIDKLKLKRNLNFSGTLKEAINKVKTLMGTYGDAESNLLDEGEPIIVSYKDTGDGAIKYFLAIGRWIAKFAAPIVIPLYSIESIKEYNSENPDEPANLDSIYEGAIQKYFSNKGNAEELLDKYFLGKSESELGAPQQGVYKIMVGPNNQISLVESTEDGRVDVDEVMISAGTKTYQLQIEYFDREGNFIQKDRATTQDEFNYFIYNLLTWKNY